jgi:hypothetical protein
MSSSFKETSMENSDDNRDNYVVGEDSTDDERDRNHHKTICVGERVNTSTSSPHPQRKHRGTRRRKGNIKVNTSPTPVAIQLAHGNMDDVANVAENSYRREENASS